MTFGKHQSFYIRDGWLTKGLKKVKKHPGFFRDDEAPEELGLGKNMVTALRWWMVASGLTEEKRVKNRAVQEILPFGKAILENDPYLEDKKSLWLVHYNLTKEKKIASTWYWFLNELNEKSFAKDQIVEELSFWAETENEKKVAKKTLEKDINCFISTYLGKTKKKTPEDTIECPLSNLGFLKEDLNNKKLYHFIPQSIKKVPPLVLAYAILDWKEKYGKANQIHIDELQNGKGSIGLIFRMNFTSIVDLLFKFQADYPELGIKLVRTEGLDSIRLPGEVKPGSILNKIYNE